MKKRPQDPKSKKKVSDQQLSGGKIPKYGYELGPDSNLCLSFYFVFLFGQRTLSLWTKEYEIISFTGYRDPPLLNLPAVLKWSHTLEIDYNALVADRLLHQTLSNYFQL